MLLVCKIAYAGVCVESMVCSQHTYPESCYILAQADTLLVHQQGFSYGLNIRRVEWIPAFLVV